MIVLMYTFNFAEKKAVVAYIFSFLFTILTYKETLKYTGFAGLYTRLEKSYQVENKYTVSLDFYIIGALHIIPRTLCSSTGNINE